MKRINYWKLNLKYYIKNAFLDNGASSVDKLDELIMCKFHKRYITDKDVELLKVVLKDDISQEEFDRFLENWDIEEEGGHKAIMLAYFMKVHPDIKYPVYIEPRLKGLLQYYRFRNLKSISYFKKVCGRLKDSNIDMLIFKGGLMRHLRPEYPRFMTDIDILVRNKENFEQAKSVAQESGCTYCEYNHSIDLSDDVLGGGVLDIHHKVDMISEAEALLNEDLFKRASLEKVFNVEGIYVPCCEDMLFLTLINLSKNIMRVSSYANILHAIIDCDYLIKLKPDFNWDIVKQNAIKTKTEDQIYIIIKFVNLFLPEKLPVMFEQEFKDKSVLYLYNDWLLANMKKKSHSLKFFGIFKKCIDDIIYYIKFRPQYVLYKRRMIRENPSMAKTILKNQKLMKK